MSFNPTENKFCVSCGHEFPYAYDEPIRCDCCFTADKYEEKLDKVVGEIKKYISDIGCNLSTDSKMMTYNFGQIEGLRKALKLIKE